MLGNFQEAIALTSNAHALSVSIGDANNIGLHLGNLGDIYLAKQELEKATTTLREAVRLCASTIPLAAGVFSGSLALALARQQVFEEAQQLLHLAEPAVHRIPEEYAKFLCKKGEVHWLEGDLETSNRCLNEARNIAANLKVTERSEVATAIVTLSARLDSDTPSSPSSTAQDWLKRGHLAFQNAMVDEAEAAFSQAVEQFRSQEDKHGEIEARGSLGKTLATMKRANEARVQFEHALELAESAGVKPAIATNLVRLGRLLTEEDRPEEATELLKQALEIASELKDVERQGACLHHLARAYDEQGEINEAQSRYHQALALRTESQAPRGRAFTTHALGGLMQRTGDLDAAAKHYQEAIALYRTLGNRHDECRALCHLATVHIAQGQLKLAKSLFRPAFKVARKLNNTELEAQITGELAEALLDQGSLTDAERAFRRAIKLHEPHATVKAGALKGSLALLLAQTKRKAEALTLIESARAQIGTDREQQVLLSIKKGHIQLLTGNPTAARATFEEGLSAVENLSPSRARWANEALTELHIRIANTGEEVIGEEALEMAILQGEQLLERGEVERLASNFAGARAHIQQALAHFSAIQHMPGVADAHSRLGHMSLKQRDLDQAEFHYNEALAIAQQLGNSTVSSTAIGNLGNVYRRRGNHDRAKELYREALNAAKEIGDANAEARHLSNLSLCYLETGELDNAVPNMQRVLTISQAIGNVKLEATSISHLGIVALIQKDYETAAERLLQAVSLRRQGGYTFDAAIDLGNYAEALAYLGRHEEAVAAFREAIDACDDNAGHFAGACRGHLAVLLAHAGELREAKSFTRARRRPRSEYPKILCAVSLP